MTRATIKDVAKSCGVSTATVSRVLNQKGYATNDIKQRVHAAVEELNYQPNAIARSLKIEQTNTIGVIIPDISNPYFMKIAKGIEDVFQQKGYNLIFCSGDETPQKEEELLQLLYKKRVDAIVLATSGGNDELIYSIHESGIPVILIDRRLNDEKGVLDIVQEDNVKGAYELTKALILKGHDRVGVLHGPLHVSTGIDRFTGYKKAVQEFNYKENESLLYAGAYTELSGKHGINYFMKLKERPTAILCFNNIMAFGAIIELLKKGYRSEKGIVIASYGQVEAAEYMWPNTISIKQDPYEMGVTAGNILTKRLVGKEIIV